MVTNSIFEQWQINFNDKIQKKIIKNKINFYNPQGKIIEIIEYNMNYVIYLQP